MPPDSGTRHVLPTLYAFSTSRESEQSHTNVPTDCSAVYSLSEGFTWTHLRLKRKNCQSHRFYGIRNVNSGSGFHVRLPWYTPVHLEASGGIYQGSC